MAVTANQIVLRQEGCRGNYPVAASTNLYEGTICFVNSSGYADDDAGSGDNRIGGVVITQADNSSGSAADIQVETWRGGLFQFPGSGFAQTDVGKKVYATDNFTVSLSAVGGVYIGRIAEYVSATKVIVALDLDSDRDDAVSSVAAAGSAQGDAAALTGVHNTVSAADGTKGVILPAGYPTGKSVTVYNEHATNGLKVYPATGDDINDGPANAAITMEGKTLATFLRLDAATWAAQFTANT